MWALNLQFSECLADFLRLSAACIVELALLIDIGQVERIGIGLVGIGRAVTEYNHVSAVAQGRDPSW
jgi:hypothetical protein